MEGIANCKWSLQIERLELLVVGGSLRITGRGKEDEVESRESRGIAHWIIMSGE